MPVRIEPVSTSMRPTTSGCSARMNSVMPAEHLAVAAQVARARQRQMEGGTGAGGVADVVDEQSQRRRVPTAKEAFYRAPRVGACRPTVRVRPAWRRGSVAGRVGAMRVSPRARLCETSRPCRRPIRSVCSSPTCGKTAMTTCACSSTSRARDNFFYRNYSTPDHAAGRRQGGASARTCAGRSRPVEAVIALAEPVTTRTRTC